MVDLTMNIFTAITKEIFLETIWQKKPYVFRHVMQSLEGLVDGNELAGLACEDDVESRIICGREALGQWTCEQGPFDESTFSRLPEQDWTLLIQGVDQWFDEAHDILNAFDFLPRWRLEDIMASYAPVGGGVGPHFDYYDVFLIQVSGSRQWQLGQECDEAEELQDNDQVKLLAEFKEQEIHQLNAGDMLYIPAGKAHWGIATSDDCITFSVGFRAPSEKELLSTLLENIAAELSDHHRYKDSLTSIDPHPAKINPASFQQLEKMTHRLTADKLQSAANQAFGELVTEPRYHAHEELDQTSTVDLTQAITNVVESQGGLSLIIPAHSRLAFSETQLFANGEAYNISEPFSQAVCDGLVPYNYLDEKAVAVLEILLEKGDVYLA